MHLNLKRSVGALLLLMGCLSCAALHAPQEERTQQELLSDFVEWRHGMFICFNIMSYGAEWGEANYPIETFNPTQLDCSQWAKAAKSAKMTFALLTTKHHEGFALWDSDYSSYDVANTPYKKDIVKQYTDAFRKEGLKVGLYYSIWDATAGIDADQITPEKLARIKGELTELLSNYGEISYLVIDGWFWRMGHRQVPYIEIRELIRELQPHCLVTDHTHFQTTYQVDVPYFEGPFGAFPPEGNTMASALGHCPVKGNGWFWSEASPHGLTDSATRIVEELTTCESRYCNYMLNCMPNRDGLLDPLYIQLLEEIGSLWSPHMERAPLPQQPAAIKWEAAIASATATSGVAANLIDGRQLGTIHTDWVSSPLRKQEIVLDLGRGYNNINLLNITQAHRCKPAPERRLTEGNITHAKLYGSQDGVTYAPIGEYRWEADGEMRSLPFTETPLRYLKLEILDFQGEEAIIAEMQVGNSHKQLVRF